MNKTVDALKPVTCSCFFRFSDFRSFFRLCECAFCVWRGKKKRQTSPLHKTATYLLKKSTHITFISIMSLCMHTRTTAKWHSKCLCNSLPFFFLLMDGNKLHRNKFIFNIYFIVLFSSIIKLFRIFNCNIIFCVNISI